MNFESPIVKCIKSRIVAVKSFDQLTWIDLSGIKTPVIPLQAKQLLDKCTNLYQIDLTGCGLNCLENLPNLSLTTLILGDNQIKDQELNKLAIYQNSLSQLFLQKNCLTSISTLGMLRNFPHLSELRVQKNPFCQQYINFQRKIFDEILNHNEKLTLIDSHMRNGGILSDDEDDEIMLEWMVGDQSESGKSRSFSSGEERKEIENEDHAMRMDVNMISLYHQHSEHLDPSTMVDLLNEHEMGFMRDPIDKCLEDELEEMEMDIEEEVKAEGGKGTVAKKIKPNQELQQIDDFQY